MAESLRLSEVAGAPLIGPAGDRVGRVADCVVRLADGDLPLVTGIVLQAGGHDTFVSRDDLKALASDGVYLAVDRLGTRRFERRPGEVLLVRDVRRRAVVDVSAPRLVRVRDLVLEGEGASWRVAAVVPIPVTTFGGWVRSLARRPAPALEEIPWSSIEPLTGHVPTAARPLSPRRLARLRPADIADIVEQASHEEGEEILTAVHKDLELEADVFEELDEEHQVEFLEGRSDAEAAEVLANMEADDAADVLMQLDRERRRPILDLLPAAEQRKVRQLLGHNPETAGGLMTTEFVAVPQDSTAGEVLQHLRAADEVADTLTVVYALGDGRLAGSIPLARLVHATPATRVADMADRDPVAVHADADVAAVAVLMADYNLSSLPVIDETGVIVGVVTYDDMIEAMLPTEWRWRGRPGEARTRRRPDSAPVR